VGAKFHAERQARHGYCSGYKEAIPTIVVGSVHHDTIHIDWEAVRDVIVMVRPVVDLAAVIGTESSAFASVEMLWHWMVMVASKTNSHALRIMLSFVLPTGECVDWKKDGDCK
jgi:hypothetical protein